MIEKRTPDLRIDQIAAAYWATHNFGEIANSTAEAMMRFVKQPKRAIAIRLDSVEVEKFEAMAEAKGLSYTVPICMWFKKHLAA